MASEREMLYLAIGLLTFALVLVVSLREWGGLGPALAGYALALGLAQGVALGPAAGAVSALATLLAVGVLALGGRLTQPAAEPPPGEPAGRDGRKEPEPLRLPTLAAAGLALLGAYALAYLWPLAGSVILSFAAYWLLAVGAVVLATAAAPLRRGIGLLLLLGGVGLLRAGLVPAADPADLAASAVPPVLLAVAAARLAAAHRPSREEAE